MVTDTFVDQPKSTPKLSSTQQAMINVEMQEKQEAKTTVRRASILDLWRTEASDVLTVVLQEPDLIVALGAENVRSGHFPTGRWQRLYEILIATDVDSDKGFNRNSIVSQWTDGVNSMTPDEKKWFEELWATEVVGYRTKHFKENIMLLKTHAEEWRSIEIARKLGEQLEKGEMDILQFRAAMSSELSNVSSGMHIDVKVTASQNASIIDTLEGDEDDYSYLDSPAYPVQEFFGGFLTPGLTAVAGAQKSQKTRFTISHALYWLTQGKEVSIYSLEQSRKFVFWQMASMIASQRAIQQYGAEARDKNGELLSNIAPKDFFSKERRVKYLGEPRRKLCVDHAREMVRGFESRLRVYDNTPKGGLIRTLDDLNGRIRSDADIYGPPTAIIVDHLHHVSVPNAEGGNINQDYNKVNAVASACHNWAGELMCAFVLLAQRDKASNQKAEPAGNMLGTKGGEALGEKIVMGIVMNGYTNQDGDEDKQFIHYWIRAARWSDPHDQLFKSPIHPQSGWIIPNVPVQ